MLGKEIGHEIGEQTNVRVLRDPSGGPVMEVSFRAQGTLLGVQCADQATYDNRRLPDGSLRGEGQGIVIGEGGEMASWEATGAGQMAEDGSATFRGCLYYTSPTPKFSELNGKCAVYEYSTDAGGKTEGRLWLWE